MSIAVSRTLDLKGLSCPLPIVKTAKAMREMSAGEMALVLATDPGSVKDFAAWAKQTGNEIVASTLDGAVYRFVIRKG